MNTAMVTSLNQLDLNKSYTYADYLTWQFDEIVELLRGKIFKMSPAPNTRHQMVSAQLFGNMYIQFKESPCQLFSAPFDVRLTEDTKKSNELVETVVQPDICIVCDNEKLDERGCNGAPDLIIEIVSKSTKKKDYNDKFDLYEENGVREYWIADPADSSLQIFSLEDDQYRSLGIYDKDNPIVGSHIFPELQIHCKDIFRD